MSYFIKSGDLGGGLRGCGFNAMQEMNRSVSQVFEEFQRARSHFVQTLADLSQKPQNIDGLRSAGALQLLRPLLLDSIPGIQQTAAVALGRLAGHSEVAARECVNEDILPHLVASVAEQNRFYRRSTALVMRSIAKHSAELSQVVCDAGAVPLLSKQLTSTDTVVRRQAVVEADALPKLLHCLKDPDELVRRNAAACVREIVKHTPQLATFAANAGAIAALVDLIQETTGPTRVAGILALGYIGAFTETLALAIIVQKGRHTPDHAMAVAEADVLRLLMAAFLAPDSSDDLKQKAKRALKMCTHLAALEPLLNEAPPSILKYSGHES
ncbi:armadillo beta-catenin-like repeat [Cyclospora cayetanensis]|uniref:Armadillo beta-catenin-like repeat n=1 Tax=Cyclospora cayetanensis TaxID=88456 RepID=A0A1D3D2V6_9EIME|nr:armadillo beta-catenin-like repeat [Cyclospora cayetanensis]